MFNSVQDTQAFEADEHFADGTAARASPLDNHAVAAGLEEIARLLPHDARNQGRGRMLTEAAALIRASRRPVRQLIEDDGVEGVHGLGIIYEISGLVTDWVRSGHMPWLERLRAQRRDDLLGLPGIGSRLAQELRDVFGIVDLDGLAKVARSGQLSNVCGFGPKRVKLVADLLAARGLATSS
jgi:DNA polymerase (family 10)